VLDLLMLAVTVVVFALLFAASAWFDRV